MRKILLVVLSFIFLRLAIFAQIAPPTFRWAHPLSNAYDLSCMKVSSAGNVYVMGIFLGGGCFDNEESHCLNSIGEGSDVFIAKYNQNGVLQWAKLVGSKYDDGLFGQEFVLDEQENIYLFGMANGDSLYVGDSLLVAKNLISVPASNYKGHRFFLKLNTNGQVLWVNQWGGMMLQNLVFKHNRLYVTGNYTLSANLSDSSYTFASGTIQTPLLKERVGMFIAQISPNNELLSYRLIPNNASTYGLAVLGDSTLLLNGYFQQGNLDLGDTVFHLAPPATNNSDYFFIALDNTYKYQWGETYDNSMTKTNIKIVPENNTNNFTIFATYTYKCLFLGDSLIPNPYYAVIKKVTSKKNVLYTRYGEVGGGGIFSLNNQHYFSVIYSKDMGDTINYWGYPLLYEDTTKAREIVLRLNEQFEFVWKRTIFEYGDFYDRSLSVSDADSFGYLYGRGRMQQFHTYLDTILVQPLAFTMNQEYFIFGMTRDSFTVIPPPPPPPVDSIAPEWKVYPNPFQNELIISGKFEKPNINLSFWDVTGRKISNQTILLNETEIKQKINLPPLPLGIYLLEIENLQQHKWIKLCKQ